MNEKDVKSEVSNTQNLKKENKSTNTNKTSKKEYSLFQGKVLTIFSNDLQFGKSDRQVNIFGLFRFKENNTNYVVYADVYDQYNIIYYATAHIKGENILALAAKKEEDNNIVKEYIFKLTNKEKLENYEMLSLDNIEYLEIIDFNKIEVKPEIVTTLINLVIPKEEKAIAKNNSKGKKTHSKTIILLLILIIFFYVGAFFLNNKPDQNIISKNILCKINYEHDELEAIFYEEKTFNFDNQDNLQNIDNLSQYVFKTSEDYQDFVNKGIYFKYQPEENNNGGFTLDDETYTYKITYKEYIDDNYSYPTNYEEVLSYYKEKGYTCEESINQ